MEDRYIHDAVYSVAVTRLETIARNFDAAAPDDLRSRIIEVLGDLGVWPDECLKEQEAATHLLAA